MSTPDGVIRFAKSQRCRMHFKNQHALIVWRKGNFLEIKALAGRRWADPSRGTQGKPSPQHRQPTVNRDGPHPKLLTAVISTLRATGAVMGTAVVSVHPGQAIHGRVSRSRLADRHPAKCGVGDSSAATSPDPLETDGIVQMTVKTAISEPRTLLVPRPGACKGISSGQQMPPEPSGTTLLSLRRGVPNSPNKGVQ